MDLFTQVKILLGIAVSDTSQDGIINYLVSYVTGLALRYCRLTASNSDIDTTLAPMIIERYRINGYGQEAAPQIVESVSEGNTSVHFRNPRNAPQSFVLSSELTAGEKTMLTPFRKLWS